MHEIQQGTLEGVRVERHRAEVRKPVELERDAPGGQCGVHLMGKRHHQSPQVLGRALDRGDPHEGQIILHEVLQAHQIPLDVRERLGNQQNPRNTRRNVLPPERIDGLLLMCHEHAACTPVELLEIGETASSSNAVLQHTPEAFNRIEVMAAAGG